MEGKEQLKKIQAFNRQANDLLTNQPPACELDASAAWLADVNAMYATWAQMWGLGESMIAQLTAHIIETLTDEEYKKIKNSSTLTDRYVKGKYPKTTAAHAELDKLGRVFQAVCDNTRTLISAYKQEREFELRTQVRQTANSH